MSITKINRSILPILACILLLCLYQILIWVQIIPPSDGINQWQINLIKVEQYIYQTKPVDTMIVGSSIAERINPNYIGPNVSNIGIAGGTSQTGAEIVKRNKNKKLQPSILMLEINDSIAKGIDEKLIRDIYQPYGYFLRLYFTMFRQKYRPISLLVNSLKNSSQPAKKINEDDDKKIFTNSVFRKKIIENYIFQYNKNHLLPEKREELIIESKYIKKQIADLQKAGIRVILFNVPREKEIENTMLQREIAELLLSLFPADTYEWLPKPPSGDWITSDGIHLIDSSAKKYALFLKEQMIKNGWLLSHRYD